MSDVFGQPLASGRVAVYVPSTFDVNQPLTEAEHQAAVDDVLRDFSRLFGGATSTRAVGAWQATDGTLVKETVTIVYAFVDLTEAQKAQVKDIARNLAKRFLQEAVLVEWSGRAYLVALF
jgi:hypothetical protein